MTKTRLSLSMPLLLMALWLPSHTALAEKIYRWVDEDGQVHFSSQPRRGVDDDTYNVQINRVIPPQLEEESPPEEETISGVSVEQAQSLCANAREVKELLSSELNRPFTREDGTVRPLTDEERKSKLEAANQRIKDYCR